VLGVQLLVAPALSAPLSRLQGFLRFDSQSIKSHIPLSRCDSSRERHHLSPGESAP
jgi:hypothetical protein